METILSLILIIICIYHVSRIIYSNIYPDVPEILVYEKNFNQIDFPISFLLCLNEFDNDTDKYREVGFKNVQDLFIGRRMNENSTLKSRLRGWSGHEVNGTVLSLEEVFDGISTDWNAYVQRISVFTVDEESDEKNEQIIEGKTVTWSEYPMYPNCQALDLKKYIQQENKTTIRIEQIKFKILTENKYAFFLYPLDRKRALTKRISVTNMLSYSGPVIGNQFKGFTKNIRVALRVSQSKYTEKDESNPCAEYPNEKFKSFRDCDEKFIYHNMKTKHNLVPFWATENISEVSDNRMIKEEDVANLNRLLNSFMDGRVGSPCPKPCLETKLAGMMTTERYWKKTHSSFFLTLDQTVTITETRFPQLDVAKLFAELGGTLGLWLGLGVIQMISFGLNLFRRISRTKLTAPVQLSVSSTTPTSPTTMLSSTTRPKAAK